MSRVELRDALIASLVIATMAILVVSIFSLIGQEGGEWALFDSLSIGLQAGIFTFVVVLFLTLLRLRYISTNPTNKVDKEETRQFLIGLGQNVMMSTSQGLAHSWDPEKKIQIIRGVITLNLIGLNPEIAVSVVQSLMDNRSRLGRLRLVIGREDSWESEISTPNIRPAVLQRLKIDAERAQWQIIQSKSTVVLRPTGTPPTKAKVLLRLTLYGPIMVPSMFFAFRDLAGTEGEVSGGAFGILMGVLLTALMASHRDRSG
ncbi:MAG: hypothetical protein VXX59_02300 [Candidatus Thermoplasmatota archaeon]|nr:hypothetical protein [Candidatus Thermoplasmatota archaeon]